MVLIVGGVAVVVFTYFFGLEHVKAQIAMTSMVALLIVLNLYLILLFAYPYSGDVKVSTQALEADLDIFQQLMSADHAVPAAK